ncbi:MAG: hypothetical protein QXD03_03915 [Candidatus Anstonellales archaeon]
MFKIFFYVNEDKVKYIYTFLYTYENYVVFIILGWGVLVMYILSRDRKRMILYILYVGSIYNRNMIDNIRKNMMERGLDVSDVLCEDFGLHQLISEHINKGYTIKNVSVV